MKKRLLATLLFGLCATAPSYSAIKIGSGDITAELGGFVRTDVFCDTRENFEVRDGNLTLLPKPERLGENNEDLNENFRMHFLSYVTRLTLKVHGPKIGEANTTGYIEADFFGTNDATAGSINLRHAYVDVDWEKTSVRVGNYWHPMIDADLFPGVTAISIGAPFQPCSRVPQIRLTQRFTQSTSGFISFNMLGSSNVNGPDGMSTKYLNNTGIPEMTAGAKFNIGDFTLGINGEYKILTPRTEYTSLLTGNTVKTDETLASGAINAYLRYKSGDFTAKAFGMYGQNMNDLMMLSGYAVKEIKPDGEWEYTGTNGMSSWLDLSYGKTTQVGLFFGYAANLGTSDNTEAKYFSRFYTSGQDIESAFRIAPRVNFIFGKLNLGAEMEYTSATYGKMNNLDKNSFDDTKSVNNIRAMISVCYNF